MNETDLLAKGYIEVSRGIWAKPYVQTRSAGSPALAQSVVRDDALAATQVEETDSARLRIVITGICKRLRDTDNNCPKYHVDFLRYAGIISGDSPQEAIIEVSQRQCAKGETERVIIEVFERV